MFRWRKLGRVFCPQDVPGRPWLKEFAQAPATLVYDDFVRVYFSCRPHADEDGQYVSYSAYVDLDRADLTRVVRVAERPILELGGLGAFDEFGTYPVSVARDGDAVVAYYGGWTRCESVPFDVAIGCARSTDGGRHWQEIETAQPTAFGFAVAVHPENPDIAWFVPGVRDDARHAVDGRVVVSRTRDGGRSFEVLREGLPQRHAYDLVYRHALDIAATGERLAFGSTTGNLWVSEDQGEHWQQISGFLPPVYCVRFQ